MHLICFYIYNVYIHVLFLNVSVHMYMCVHTPIGKVTNKENEDQKVKVFFYNQKHIKYLLVMNDKHRYKQDLK